MFRNILITTSLLSILLFCSVALANGPVIAVIDVERVVATSRPGQAMQKKLKKILAKKQKDLNKRQEEFAAKQEQLTRQASVMSQEQRRQVAEQLQQEYMTLQEDFMKQQQELAKKELELLQPVFKKLETILANIAEKRSLDMILGKGQQGVLWSKPAYDITDEALKALNAAK